MTTLVSAPRLRLAMLCLLYVAQGLPFGFVTIALAAWLKEQGATTAAVGGVTGFALLPWSFKWAWGPLVDSGIGAALGRRRPWLIVAQAAMIATCLALAEVPTGSLALLAWLLLLHNVFVGMQDVAVDALAVDMLAGRERERASGMMYGSSYVGTFLGSVGLGIVAARFGLRAAILAMAGFQVVMLLLVIAIRERPGDRWLPGIGGARVGAAGAAEHPPFLGIVGMARALARAMTRREMLAAASAAVLLKVLPQALTVVLLGHLIDHMGWTQERYSMVTGYGTLLGLGASVAGGFLSGWIGPRVTALVSNGLMALAWIGFGLLAPWWGRSDVVFAWVAADAVFMAATSVALFAIFMRVATPAVAATQFTASMALMNLATSIGSWLAGPLAGWCAAPTAFLVCGLLQPLGALLLPRVEADDARPPATPDRNDDHS